MQIILVNYIYFIIFSCSVNCYKIHKEMECNKINESHEDEYKNNGTVEQNSKPLNLNEYEDIILEKDELEKLSIYNIM